MMLCRTCLKNTFPEDLIPLFGGLFPHKIEVISSVKLVEDNNLPSMVCTQCTLNINFAFNFRLVIMKSDLILHNNDWTEARSQTSENIDVSVESESSECSSVKSTSEQIDNDNGTLDSTDDIEIEREVYSANDKSEMPEDPFDDNQSNEVKQYRCCYCDFKPKTFKQLLHHRRIHQVICSICGKSLLPQNMKKHTVIHYGSPVACKVCGNVCKNSVSLRSHMLYHRGRERTCPICGKVYVHSSIFRMHMRKHTTPKVKKYKCHICEKSVGDTDSLKKHIRSHTGERPYMCEFCKKGFSSRYALKTHRRQHTKERPFACALCPMAFPQRVSLRTHLKSKHSSEQQ